MIFCPISEAVRDHPELVRQYLGTVVPPGDNFFAALNSRGVHRWQLRVHPQGRALPDGAVHLFPHQCAQHRPVRAHADHRRGRRLRQLPRRLHRAACATRTSCMPRWSSWSRMDDAQIKYSHGAELVSGRRRRPRRHLQLRHQARRLPRRAQSKICWTQVETGSAITWKYPSCVLQGDDSVGEFYSVAVTNNRQQADTGTKMIHIGKRHAAARSSPRASAPAAPTTPIAAWCAILPHGDGRAQLHPVRQPADRRPVRRAHRALYRKPQPDGEGGARGDHVQDRRRPVVLLPPARPVARRTRSSLIVNGFCKEVLKELPMEFAVEAQKLLAVCLEGSVG